MSVLQSTALYNWTISLGIYFATKNSAPPASYGRVRRGRGRSVAKALRGILNFKSGSTDGSGGGGGGGGGEDA